MPPARLRKMLAYVGKAATELDHRISNLPEQARMALQVERESQLVRELDHAGGSPGAPTATLTVPEASGEETTVEVDLEEMRALLRGLSAAAKRGESRIGRGRPGERKDPALRLWMGNAADIWTDFTGRRFTRDIDPNGEPVTDAARFCVDAFAHVDPETSSGRVMEAMKDCITRRRARTGGIRRTSAA